MILFYDRYFKKAPENFFCGAFKVLLFLLTLLQQ